MKLSIIFLASGLLCESAASAEWLRVSQDGFSTIYMDPASRKTSEEGTALVQALTDYDARSPEAAGFKLSEKGLSEIESVRFDCRRRLYGSDGGRWFAGQMASGALRSEYPAKTVWSKAPPYYAGLYARVCAGD